MTTAAAPQTSSPPPAPAGDSGSAEGTSCLEYVIAQPRLNNAVIVAALIAVIGIAFSAFHLHAAYFGQAQSYLHRTMHVTFMVVLCILLKPAGRKSWKDPINAWFAYDLFCIATTLAVQAYICWDVIEFINRRGTADPMDLTVGVAMILLIMEATRRVIGWMMVVLGAFFILQSAYGDHFFGIFYGPAIDWSLIINDLFMEEEGIYTIPISISASFVVLFIIFGAFIMRTGVGELFKDVAYGLMGRQVGGPAKAAVVSSAFMASISGSAVSNVATTGTFTIPLMKRMGYPPAFAGAVEACASTGGVFTPPIMGAVAFIMAEFMGISYWEVAKAAAIPAVIYFTAVLSMVHFRSHRMGLAAHDKEDLPSVSAALKERGHMLLPIVVLVGALVIGYSPIFSALLGIVAVFALSFIRPETRLSPVTFLGALEDAARMMVSVAIPSAAAGLIVGALYFSGLAVRFSSSIIDLSQGSTLLALCLAMVICIVLGMGITVTALYILVAALVVPALTKLGVEPMAAHLFAFHFGVHSYITPPVALSAFAAAAIAGSEPMKTGFQAAKLGLAAYLIPFMFVYSPGLVWVGEWWEILIASGTALIGVIALAAAVEGWLLQSAVAWQRLVLGAGALFLVAPPLWTHLAGFALVGGVCALQWMARTVASRPAPKTGTGGAA
ncbi:MAG TPA: C4-dicarboxylate ABC transporter [Rhodospirillaceae bacterium]|nr:C4-dicarboxylate ABC transporter [Rhodospirillaceae bacterium]